MAGKSTAEILKAGIGLVPEDRKAEVSLLSCPLPKFVCIAGTLKVLRRFIKGIKVDSHKEREIVDEYIQKLSVKAPDSETAISSLSGGNQQKVIIASWLAADPKVLILDEPTRGVDVGSKSEIYEIMNELVKMGVSIIMVSSELPEILNMSDRIMVMNGGRITKVLNHDEATQEIIMQYAVNM